MLVLRQLNCHLSRLLTQFDIKLTSNQHQVEAQPDLRGTGRFGGGPISPDLTYKGPFAIIVIRSKQSADRVANFEGGSVGVFWLAAEFLERQISSLGGRLLIRSAKTVPN